MSPKVLIIGCGVAGPVIALLLKRKGYSQVVVERAKSLGYEGSALSLAPNGYVLPFIFTSPRSLAYRVARLKVLSALELAKPLTDVVPPYKVYKDLTWDGDLLAGSHLATKWPEEYGQPMVGIIRSFLNRSLKNALSSTDIPLICEFKASEILEGEESVTVMAEDGRK